MGEFLDLIYDYIVWNFYVLVVVCLVNFIIKIIIMNNNSFVFFLDEVFFVLVWNNVYLKFFIFGFGILFEFYLFLCYLFFCFYVYRNENKMKVFIKDFVVEYNYMDFSIEYYQVLRYKDFSNIFIVMDKVYFR